MILLVSPAGSDPQGFLKQSSTSLSAVFIQSSSNLDVFGVIQSDPEIHRLVHFAGH